MAGQRNRIIEITDYLTSLGIKVNIGKNKARGNRGVFLGKTTDFRIDVAKNLPEDKVLPVLIHEFAHYVHFCNDSKMESLDFICKNMSEEIEEELINVTVDTIPKTLASNLYEHKKILSNEIKSLSYILKSTYRDFKLSSPYKRIERSLKFPVKHLLRHDKIQFLKRIYSIETLEHDFPYLTPEQIAYIKLKSKQRTQKRINTRITKLNKYYRRPAELFARFAEVYFLEPEKSKEIAPIFSGIMTSKLKENSIPEFVQLNKILSNVEVS